MSKKLFAGVLIGAMTVFGPVGAQAEKNDAGAAMSRMAPASSAQASELTAFQGASQPMLPGVDNENQGVRKPDPTITWLLALGFLGLVVLRRTRQGQSF
jgi:hypothetical protein